MDTQRATRLATPSPKQVRAELELIQRTIQDEILFEKESETGCTALKSVKMDCTEGLETPEILLQGPSGSFSDSSCGSSTSSLNIQNAICEGSSAKISNLQVINSERKDFPLIFVTKNETFGRYIIAKENIPAGSIIVSEPPACFGPDGDGCEGYEIPLCLGCCMIMNDDNEDVRCSKCGWPVCSESCENISHHADNECQYFRNKCIRFPPPVGIAACYKGIQILRGLMLRWRQPEKWPDLLQLQDWTDEDCEAREFEGLETFRKDVLRISEEEKPLWDKILGIYNVNSFSFMMKCETEERSPSFAEFVFLTTSLFSHSCAPNANWQIGCSPDFTMRVRTTVDIPAGSMITLPYTYDHMNFGTYGRVIRQQSFRCKCHRCVDPTELNTFNSAIKCYKCHQGLVLPQFPTNIKSVWICGLCSSSFTGDMVILFVEALADEVENCENVEELERFIDTHKNKTLHANHWVLNLAANSILSHGAHNLGDMSVDELDRFLGHCFYILQILNTLAPGISLFRGNVLLLISRALLTKTELSIRSKLISDRVLIREQMKQVYSYQSAAFAFWQQDHSYRPVSEMYGPEAKDLIQEMTRVHNQYLKDV